MVSLDPVWPNFYYNNFINYNPKLLFPFDPLFHVKDQPFLEFHQQALAEFEAPDVTAACCLP